MKEDNYKYLSGIPVICIKCRRQVKKHNYKYINGKFYCMSCEEYVLETKRDIEDKNAVLV